MASQPRLNIPSGILAFRPSLVTSHQFSQAQSLTADNADYADANHRTDDCGSFARYAHSCRNPEWGMEPGAPADSLRRAHVRRCMGLVEPRRRSGKMHPKTPY